MRNFIILSALALSACTTTKSYVIDEPERTEYYYFCIANGVPVTTCQCMESRTVEKTGITSINEADVETQQKFVKALNDEIVSCQEETLKLLKKDEE